jgi:hypothetical protein
MMDKKILTCKKEKKRNEKCPLPAGHHLRAHRWSGRKFFKNPKTNSADVRRMGLSNAKNRLFLSIIVSEKSRFYGTPPQTFFSIIQYFTSWQILSLTRYDIRCI